MIQNYSFDIDLDFADRDKVLSLIKHTPAAINRDGKFIKHNTGVYITKVPVDELTSLCSIDYKKAEEIGYFKLDLLNVNVYSLIKDDNHYKKLLETEPPWERLNEESFVKEIIHINNYFWAIKKLPDPINSIEKMAMFLAIIRPAKKHLMGLPWKEIEKTVWEKSENGDYGFKKSHSISYSCLCALHMNLVNELI